MLFILSTYLLTLGMGAITIGTIFKDIGNAGYKVNENCKHESDPKIKFLTRALFLTPVVNVLGIMGLSLVYVTNKDNMLDQFERSGLITEMTPEEIEKYDSATSTREKINIIFGFENNNDIINKNICSNTYTIDFGNDNTMNFKADISIKNNKINVETQDIEVTNKMIMMPKDIINFIIACEITKDKENLNKNNEHIDIKSDSFNFYVITYLYKKIKDTLLDEKDNQEKIKELKEIRNIFENCRDKDNNKYDEAFKGIEVIITKGYNSIISDNPSLETSNDDEIKLSLTQKNTRNQ